MTSFVGILTAFLGTLGFSVVFRSKKQHIIAISLGGALSWAAYLLSAQFINYFNYTKIESKRSLLCEI